MKKLLLPVLLFLLVPFFANGQYEASKIVKDIKGDVDEIIIKSEGKEYSFSGDEAKQLFSAMKGNIKMKHFEFHSNDGRVFKGDSLHKRIVVKKFGDELDDEDNNILLFIGEDENESDVAVKTIEKKVIVTEENGEKIVTVTTYENGEKNVTVYEGKAAEEYLDTMKDENELQIKVDVDKDSKHNKIKKIIIEKEEKTK